MFIVNFIRTKAQSVWENNLNELVFKSSCWSSIENERRFVFGRAVEVPKC